MFMYAFSSWLERLVDLIHVPQDLNLVTGRFIAVDDTFRSQSVQIRLGLRVERLCSRNIIRLHNLLDHCSHTASMFAIAKSARSILAHPLDCRSVLGH